MTGVMCDAASGNLGPTPPRRDDGHHHRAPEPEGAPAAVALPFILVVRGAHMPAAGQAAGIGGCSRRMRFPFSLTQT